MRNSICLIFFSLMVCACSSAPFQNDENIPYQHADLIVPIEDFEPLKNGEYIASMEVDLLSHKSKVWEQSELREWNLTEPPRLPFCGVSALVNYERGNLEDGAKFRVVGATEAWIPVEGKVTRVLHIQMVNNW